MREIDGFIRSGKLNEARERLETVRSMDPDNPYVTAFEERIADLARSTAKKAGAASPGPQKTTEEMMREREALEARLRSEIETEYSERFTKELRAAEQKASEMLAQEQEKLREQREHVRDHYQKNFETLQQQLDEEYKQRLEEEVKGAEARLSAQSASAAPSQESRAADAAELEQKRQQLHAQLEAQFAQQLQERLTEERKKIEEESDRELEKERVRLRQEREARLSEGTESVKHLRADLKNEMERNFIKRLEQVQKEYDGKMELLGLIMPQTKEDRVALYRQRLSSVYSTGGPSLEQARDLMRLKELLELTYEDHLAVESDARIEQYVKELEKGITSGTLNFNDRERLEELKKKYRLQPEEAARLEPFILEAFRKASMKATILMADDEDDIRLPLQEILESQGYNVIGCSSVNEALEKLKTTSVDLIISDIKYAPGEPDGFKFFQTVVKTPELRATPFILLSSLSDDVIVRSGMQLGIDDYLTKPIDPDMLIAVVEGRLRRTKRGL
jgi:CheY-like chemotaxis protein